MYLDAINPFLARKPKEELRVTRLRLGQQIFGRISHKVVAQPSVGLRCERLLQCRPRQNIYSDNFALTMFFALIAKVHYKCFGSLFAIADVVCHKPRLFADDI